MGKKGAMSWEYIAGAVIVIVVLLVVGMIVSNAANKGGEQLEDKIKGTGDEDKDGVPNFLDKCPCDNGVGEKWPDGKEGECPKKCS